MFGFAELNSTGITNGLGVGKVAGTLSFGEIIAADDVLLLSNKMFL